MKDPIARAKHQECGRRGVKGNMTTQESEVASQKENLRTTKKHKARGMETFEAHTKWSCGVLRSLAMLPHQEEETLVCAGFCLWRPVLDLTWMVLDLSS